MKGKDDSPPKSSAASCSSVATTPISQASGAEEHESTADGGNTTVALSQADVVMPLLALAGISATSMSAILAMCVPFPVLVALVSFLFSTGYLMYLCLLLLIKAVRGNIQRDGIGAYLPASIYNQLTELTLHEWMQDTSLTLEYRHLLLYFLPGLNPDQLETYVDALAPRHRDNLRRPGLGHIFGPNFMRLLMGDARYNTQAMDNQVRPTELLLPPSQQAPEADVGSDLASPTPEALSSEPPNQRRSRSIPNIGDDQIVSRTITVIEDNTEEHQQEESILNEAMNAMMNSFVTGSVGTVTTAFAGIVEQVTPYIFGTGFGVTAFSAGLGLFGMAYPDRTTSRHFPSSRIIWSTAFVGGFSAGGTLLFRSTVRWLATTTKAGKHLETEKKKN